LAKASASAAATGQYKGAKTFVETKAGKYHAVALSASMAYGIDTKGRGKKGHGDGFDIDVDVDVDIDADIGKKAVAEAHTFAFADPGSKKTG
jgi:hypothetical protein